MNNVMEMCLFVVDALESFADRRNRSDGPDLGRIRLAVSREEYEELGKHAEKLMKMAPMGAEGMDLSLTKIDQDATISMPPDGITVFGIRVVVDDARSGTGSEAT